ncbi:MAG TPA: SCO family protein [Lacipirellulaceae bacterium]|nr:SCO family protein [Lacipirellulaceae bacterium]
MAVVLSAAYGGYKLYQVKQSQSQGGIVAIQLPPLEDFELTDHDGAPFRSNEMRGKVWVASFFFSNCPSNCARLNSNIKTMTERPGLEEVTWVSITVDPEVDTTARLADYARMVNAAPNWKFCRHDEFSYIKRLAHDVFTIGGVALRGHNDYVVVVDKRGEIAGIFDGYDMKSLEKSVQVLLQSLGETVDGPGNDSTVASDAEAA